VVPTKTLAQVPSRRLGMSFYVNRPVQSSTGNHLSCVDQPTMIRSECGPCNGQNTKAKIPSNSTNNSWHAHDLPKKLVNDDIDWITQKRNLASSTAISRGVSSSVRRIFRHFWSILVVFFMVLGNETSINSSDGIAGGRSSRWSMTEQPVRAMGECKTPDAIAARFWLRDFCLLLLGSQIGFRSLMPSLATVPVGNLAYRYPGTRTVHQH
jgi:hypothetical protein